MRGRTRYVVELYKKGHHQRIMPIRRSWIQMRGATIDGWVWQWINWRPTRSLVVFIGKNCTLWRKISSNLTETLSSKSKNFTFTPSSKKCLHPRTPKIINAYIYEFLESLIILHYNMLSLLFLFIGVTFFIRQWNIL